MALGVSPAELVGDRWAPWDSVPTLSPTPSTLVMYHCQRRGSPLLLGQECHLHVQEQGGVAQVRAQHRSPGASTGCSARGVRTCLPGTKLGPAEGEMVASPGKAVRRAIPRLTTQGRARLRPVGLLAVLVTLLPPSGNPEHWALREEGPQPLKQTWCLQSSPTLSWNVYAHVHSTGGRLHGPELGRSRQDRGRRCCWTPGPHHLHAHTCRSLGRTPTPSQTCPMAPWTWLSWRGWLHGDLGAAPTRSVSSFAWRTPTAAQGAGCSPSSAYASQAWPCHCAPTTSQLLAFCPSGPSPGV